jgi:hypothetical protein
LRSFGHVVKLIAPQLVKPYVMRGKNDTADAEALCKAMSRPTMRFVPVKTAEQQAAVMMVGLRDRLIRNRTQLSNAVRGYAAEFTRGMAHIDPLLDRIQADESVPVLARELFAGAVFSAKTSEMTSRADSTPILPLVAEVFTVVAIEVNIIAVAICDQLHALFKCLHRQFAVEIHHARAPLPRPFQERRRNRNGSGHGNKSFPDSHREVVHMTPPRRKSRAGMSLPSHAETVRLARSGGGGRTICFAVGAAFTDGPSGGHSR